MISLSLPFASNRTRPLRESRQPYSDLFLRTKHDQPLSKRTRPCWKTPSQYSKAELDALIQRANAGDSDAVEEAVHFAVSESFGIWHGRARAKICRRLKNHPPSPVLRSRLVEAILQRLTEGRFSEQFKDQLALALRFEPARTRATAKSLLESPKPYVVRYANWLIAKSDAIEASARDLKMETAPEK